jgi:hypothetical protein
VAVEIQIVTLSRKTRKIVLSAAEADELRSLLTELLNRPLMAGGKKHYIYTPRPIRVKMWDMNLEKDEVVLTLKEANDE